jgi:hypothetical protein
MDFTWPDGFGPNAYAATAQTASTAPTTGYSPAIYRDTGYHPREHPLETVHGEIHAAPLAPAHAGMPLDLLIGAVAFTAIARWYLKRLRPTVRDAW